MAPCCIDKSAYQHYRTTLVADAYIMSAAALASTLLHEPVHTLSTYAGVAVYIHGHNYNLGVSWMVHDIMTVGLQIRAVPASVGRTHNSDCPAHGRHD